ncbi:MAG: hypothetical protein IKD69_02690 [Solobacterium sp.]|nr:hypothetical protein [Solobacterium sp.]
MAKKKHKYEYLKEFHVNDKGDYEFAGRIYVHDDTQIPLRTVMTNLFLCTGIILAGLIIAGVLPAGGLMNAFYVILPFAVSIGIGGYLTMILLELARSRGSLRDYRYEKTVLRLEGVCKTLLITLIMSFIGEVIFLTAAKDRSRLAMDILQTLLIGACVPVCATLPSWLKKMQWKVSENKKNIFTK